MSLRALLGGFLTAAAGAALCSCSIAHHERAPDIAPTPIPPTVPNPVPPQPLTPGAAPPPPANLLSIPDAIPHWEPRSRYGNPRSYDVFGQRYYVSMSSDGYVERGVASWYGPGFHAVRTSIGESYDMYAMTAAHKTLPLPTYVRVTNLDNGRSVIVRVNDRGPFVTNRIIDLSYTAAAKLDMLRIGTAMVEVRAIDLTDVVSSPAAPATVDSKAQPPVLFGTPPALIGPPSATASVTAQGLSPTPTPAPVSAPMSDVPTPIPPTIPRDAAPPTAQSPPAPFKKKPLFMQAGAFADRANAESLAQKLRAGNFGAVSIRSGHRKGKILYRVCIGPIRGVPDYDRVAAALERAGVRDAQLALD